MGQNIPVCGSTNLRDDECITSKQDRSINSEGLLALENYLCRQGKGLGSTKEAGVAISQSIKADSGNPWKTGTLIHEKGILRTASPCSWTVALNLLACKAFLCSTLFCINIHRNETSICFICYIHLRQLAPSDVIQTEEYIVLFCWTFPLPN